jgi:SWI/SNF-related matrix-associated actin-dependent regulator 1 of chromatin subfamily A
MSGSSNLAELQFRMRAKFMVRRLKQNVLKELPEKIREVIPIEANKANDKLSKQIEENLASDLRIKQLREKLGEAAKGKASYSKAQDVLHQAEMEFVLYKMAEERRELGVSKVPIAIEFIKLLLEGGCEKLVVFAHHHEVIQKLQKAFKDMAVVLYGPTYVKHRQQAVDSFQNDKNTKIFIGAIQAAGVGLTLTAASRMLFVESSWVPGDISQCEDRIHRVGQTQQVIIQHLVIDKSIESRMVMRVLQKQKVIDQALDKEGGA